MMVVTTVNGEDDVPVCLDACSDTWEEEFFDNLDQEDQGKEQDEEAILSLEDIQLFLESRGRLQDAMQVGNFMDNLSAVQIATANRPLFMISFNSNSSFFRVSFNFVNTCYFFVICSFSPKKHHYKENLRDGTNLSTRTEHLVPNAVTPRRFHCSRICDVAIVSVHSEKTRMKKMIMIIIIISMNITRIDVFWRAPQIDYRYETKARKVMVDFKFDALYR